MLPVECLCTLARRSARSLTEIYDKAIAASGLKVTQFSLLRAIERLDDPTLTDLATATGLDRSTLGRNLRLLGNAGFVELLQGEDERTKVAQLTSEAKKALAIALPLWERTQDQISNALPRDTKKQLKNLAAKIDSLQ